MLNPANQPVIMSSLKVVLHKQLTVYLVRHYISVAVLAHILPKFNNIIFDPSRSSMFTRNREIQFVTSE